MSIPASSGLTSMSVKGRGASPGVAGGEKRGKCTRLEGPGPAPGVSNRVLGWDPEGSACGGLGGRGEVGQERDYDGGSGATASQALGMRSSWMAV
jgi:hypothetical protein